MFEKSLQDLVKGIRNAKRETAQYISNAIQECKTELRSTDPFIKAQAVRKLTFLHMLGYDMGWAAFSIVETMSAARFAHKRIGFLAANQAFTEETEVLLLCTNLLKKDFGSKSEYEVGLALNCLANIASRDLAEDLLGDVVQMLASSRPYIRKKAVLALYKLYLKYPQGLRLTFERLKERLGDQDVAVVSCAVNVICELARKKPKNYLSLAPTFFRLLTTSSNNWMLIKVVKLLGSLVPEEPRLARKLLEPLATIVQNTPAKSLLYECIHTVTLALPYTRRADGTEARNVPAVVRLCTDQLRQFVLDQDQNLKYLGLVGLVNLMRSHPRVVAEHRELILQCLSDEDVTIRMRSLELLTGMVTRRTLVQLVVKLLEHALSAEGAYRDDLIAKVVYVCSRDKYAFLSNFAWYVSVLVDLAHVEGDSHGPLVAAQLMDVSLRVATVRPYAVHCMLELLMDPRLLTGRGRDTMAEVLYAAAWITGEYAEAIEDDAHLEVDDDEESTAGVRPRLNSTAQRSCAEVISALLHARVLALPPHVQAVFVQSALKVAAVAVDGMSADEQRTLAEVIAADLEPFAESVHVEVQERAVSFTCLLRSLGLVPPAGAAELPAAAFSPEQVADVLRLMVTPQLAPVNPKAQRKVPVPDGLDLDAPIDVGGTADLEAEETAGEDMSAVSFISQPGASSSAGGPSPFAGDAEDDYRPGRDYGSGGSDSDRGDRDRSGSDQDRDRDRDDHHLDRHRERNDPFYIKSPAEREREEQQQRRAEPADLMDFGSSGDEGGNNSADEARRRRKAARARRRAKRTEYSVDTSELMPAGARESDSDDAGPARPVHDDDATDLGDIDITTPLRDDEVIPERRHHEVRASADDSRGGGKRGKKHGKKSKSSKKKSSSKRSGSPPAAAAADGDLLGFEFGGSAPAPAAASGDLLGGAVDMLGLDPLAGAPAGASAAAPAPAPAESSRRHKSSKSAKSAKSSKAAKAAKSSKSHKSKGKKKHKPRTTYIELCADEAVRAYTVATHGGSGAMGQPLIRVEVKVENKSRSPVEDVDFVCGGAAAQGLEVVIPADDAATTDDGEAGLRLVAGELRGKSKHAAVVQLRAGPSARVARPLQLAGRLVYRMPGVPAAIDVPFTLHVPISSLLRDTPMSTDEFTGLLGSGSFTWHHSSARLNMADGMEVEDAIEVLRHFLHATVVESLPGGSTSLYAMGPSGQHLAMLAKASGRAMTVEFKGTEDSIVSFVAQEVSESLF